MNFKHVALALVAASLWLACPSLQAQGLDEVVFSVTLSGALGVGVEASWALTEHDHICGGLSVLFHMEEGSSFVQLWPRVVYLRELTPREPFSLYGGAGLGAFFALVDFPPPLTRPIMELPWGFRYSISDQLTVHAQVRTAALFFRETPELAFLGLTAGAGYALP